MPACVLPNCNNPLLTIVGPVYVLPLLPEYVSVPGPVLVTPPRPKLPDANATRGGEAWETS